MQQALFHLAFPVSNLAQAREFYTVIKCLGICITLEQLEAEVLALPKDSQVILLARLLERLGEDSGIDQEIMASWAEEAEKRDEAMDINQVSGIPAKEVFQRVRASLQ